MRKDTHSIVKIGDVEVKIDMEDEEKIKHYGRWGIKNGYAWAIKYLKFEGKWSKPKVIYMHRLIMDFPDSDEFVVDHINRDRFDNRKKNLRIISIHDSSQNTSGVPSALSKYRGVTFNKVLKKWVAQIKYKNTHLSLGIYDDEKDAACAAAGARKSNFPLTNETDFEE